MVLLTFVHMLIYEISAHDGVKNRWICAPFWGSRQIRYRNRFWRVLLWDECADKLAQPKRNAADNDTNRRHFSLNIENVELVAYNSVS